MGYCGEAAEGDIEAPAGWWLVFRARQRCQVYSVYTVEEETRQ